MLLLLNIMLLIIIVKKTKLIFDKLINTQFPCFHERFFRSLNECSNHRNSRENSYFSNLLQKLSKLENFNRIVIKFKPPNQVA